VLENEVTTPIEDSLMLDKTTMKFSHIKPGDTDFKGEGLRDFFVYRDLGIAEATPGKVLAQLVRPNNAPEKGHRLALSRCQLPRHVHAEGLGPFRVQGQGDPGRGRRLLASAPRDRALPL
jgi:hypothetical protein